MTFDSSAMPGSVFFFVYATAICQLNVSFAHRTIAKLDKSGLELDLHFRGGNKKEVIMKFPENSKVIFRPSLHDNGWNWSLSFSFCFPVCPNHQSKHIFLRESFIDRSDLICELVFSQRSLQA